MKPHHDNNEMGSNMKGIGTGRHLGVAALLLSSLLGGAGAAAADATAAKPGTLRVDGESAEKRPVVRSKKTRGDAINVKYDACKVTGDIKFTETVRKTRLQHDLQVAAGHFIDKSAPGCEETTKTYILKHERANLVVTATNAGNEEIESVTVVTGPAEHFSLGLDLPVTNRETLKYDSASKSLVPRDDAPPMYLSLNFTPGDVLAERAKAELKDVVHLKLMVAAKSRPLQSYGVGIGYKLREMESIGLAGFSVFAGYFVTKEDKLTDCECAPALNEGKRRGWRFGLSYDLSTAIGWIKS
jgi:hypothetical protein